MFFNILLDVCIFCFLSSKPAKHFFSTMYDLYILNEKFFIVVLSRSLFLCLFVVGKTNKLGEKKALDAEN